MIQEISRDELSSHLSTSPKILALYDKKEFIPSYIFLCYDYDEFTFTLKTHSSFLKTYYNEGIQTTAKGTANLCSWEKVIVATPTFENLLKLVEDLKITISNDDIRLLYTQWDINSFDIKMNNLQNLLKTYLDELSVKS